MGSQQSRLQGGPDANPGQPLGVALATCLSTALASRLESGETWMVDTCAPFVDAIRFRVAI